MLFVDNKLENVLILDILPEYEYLSLTHANSYTISSIVNYFESHKCKVSYFSYRKIRIVGDIIKFAYSVRNNKLKGGNKRHLNSLTEILFVLLGCILYFIPSFIDNFSTLLKQKHYERIILSYPFSIIGLHHKIKKLSPNSTIYLLEHNIEFKYYSYNLGNKGKSLFHKIVIHILQTMEEIAVRLSNAVYAVSFRDANYINSKFSHSKALVIPPFLDKQKHFLIGPANFSWNEINNNSQFRFDSKRINLLFMGSETPSNVYSVEFIIREIESSMSINVNVELIIVGNIYKSFTNRADLPIWVHFLGFIDYPYGLMCLPDAFLVTDVLKTGYESKIYSYTPYNKPIIMMYSNSNDWHNYSTPNCVELKNREELFLLLTKLKNKKNTCNYCSILRQ